MFGLPEWGIVVVAIVILFGASAIPKLARNIGKAKSEFKAGLKEGEKDEETEDDKKSE
ncbi:MAG: twin-arginine translocase TatA/TatE family subunit [Lentisphaeria bacterium]|nr:twin-arginine translocase TatA/TatE family subunit [Lentisphaeria bacterium]